MSGMNTKNIAAVFDKCTDCDKDMKEILVRITDTKKMNQMKKDPRRCRECAKEQNHTDSVIDIELRKAGII